MKQIAACIDEGVDAARREDEAALAGIGDDVRELALNFPSPGAPI